MDAFKSFSLSNNWYAIWPEITLGIIALLILLLDLFIKNNKSHFITSFTILGQGVTLVLLLLFGMDSGGVNFSGMIMHSPLIHVMRVFFLITSILVTYIAYNYFKKQGQLPRTEYYLILLISTAALMLLVQSVNFVMLFVALETFAVSLYVMISYGRDSTFSLESGLKYLILSALSSSILLFGIVLLYGIAGNSNFTSITTDAMNFFELKKFIDANSHNIIVQVAVVLILSGLFFKIGAVPFQIWIPDVYQGAPTPTTAYLAVASKSAGFFVLINLISLPFASMEYLLVPLLTVIATLTILFGNITALSQHNVKRLLGLSGISHAGYLLIGVIASFSMNNNWAIPGIIFYLFTYLLGSFAVFSVMSHISTQDDSNQLFEHYENLSKQNPFLAGILAIGVGSLAGIPPLAGFMGKLLIFIAAFKSELYFLLGVAIMGVVISIYYYFGWIREVYSHLLRFPEKEGEKRQIPLHFSHKLVMGIIGGITILLGIYQGFLLPLIL